MSAITTHVLDTALGRPAEGVPVRLEFLGSAPTSAEPASTADAGPADQSADSAGATDASTATGGAQTPTTLAAAATNADGRVADLGPDRVEAGVYRLVFDTGTYFAATGQSAFFPEVSLTFTLTDPEQHYHVPVLLSPFAYSTYRGS